MSSCTGTRGRRRYAPFRDALRQDAALAKEYEQFKACLARENPVDRDAYTNGKAKFVARVLAAAAISDPADEYPAG